MKRALLSTAGILLAAAVSVPAQTIAGTWQGELSFGPNTQRIAFSIEKKPDGAFRGGVKWVDDDHGMLLDTISLSGSDVTFSQPFLGLTFSGQLSADGKSIAGTWAQYNRSYPLTLGLASPGTLWKPAGPAPMDANADPAYEVAIIKPAPPEEQHPTWNLTALEFHATGMSAGELIKIVYKIRGRQILNMPPWVADTKFDITAKPDTPGVPTEDQTRIMIRKLLTERFHLVCHPGTQDFPVLSMTLDPKGPLPTSADPNFKGNNDIYIRQEGGEYLLKLSGTTMPFFLKTLMDRYRDKQIVDHTGLTGTYDIMLHLPLAALQGIGDGGAEDEVGSDYIAAAQKAGFKFASKKEPIPAVVIDHIDLPTPN
jgi:uncharacterized protein (TIGR03435 family)